MYIAQIIATISKYFWYKDAELDNTIKKLIIIKTIGFL